MRTMRPKRASSWNISRTFRPRTSCGFSKAASSPGSFFPVLLDRRVVLGVSGVRSSLAPAVASEHAVHHRRRNRMPQSLRQRCADWGDNQHAALGRPLPPWLKERLFLLQAHGCMAPATPLRRCSGRPRDAISQPRLVSRHRCPTHAQHGSRLLQRGPQQRRHQHRLRATQIFEGIGLQRQLLRFGHQFRIYPPRSGHAMPPSMSTDSSMP